MTEDEARQVLLLQALEAGTPAPSWTHEDRAWATRQAAATVGEIAAPERFVVARAVLALQRLLPRDRAAQRWLGRRGWHPAWVLLALAAGFIGGLAADQLGPPQRVNLLAPAVWAVVAWNLAVYAALLLPLPRLGLRDALARLGLRGPGGDLSASALWAQHAAPLMTDRAALVLHSAAAALGAGLMTGLYLRGLVLDYRAGWQSTFLDAEAVQQGLAWLLAPASRLTGIAVPDVAPLRVGPGGDATASAAPWIHLYAATLGLAVLLPRTLLALRAAWAARRRSARFPLPLDTPYFEGLHPLMRPGLPRVLRLLWLSDAPQAVLFGVPLGPSPGDAHEPVTLLRSDEGDELQLLPAPATLGAHGSPTSAPWWAVWRPLSPDPLHALREQVSAVLLVTAPGAPRPAALARLARPVVVLHTAGGEPMPPSEGALRLDQLADGWLADGRLLQALAAVLDDDPRWRRLDAAWRAQQAKRFDALVAELAATLSSIACTREPLADDGALLSRRGGGADAAREGLLRRLDAEVQAHGERLSTLLGLAAPQAGDAATVHRVGEAALHARVGEGRAALVGGVLSGALAGLKADLLSGGLTMGAGAVAGGLIGALGAAGAARGFNVVRGTDRSFVAWDEAALAGITEALLVRGLVLAHGVPAEAAPGRLAPALAAQQGTMATLWRTRGKGRDEGETAALATNLLRPLADALAQALGGPSPHGLSPGGERARGVAPYGPGLPRS